MKLKNIAALPFALVADVVSLGNMGGRSFTQQVLDKDTHEKEVDAVVEILKAIAEAKK